MSVMSVMAQHPEPSDVEELALDFPHAEIYREVLPDGSHGDWIASYTLRAPTPAALRGLLASVDLLCRSAPDADG